MGRMLSLGILCAAAIGGTGCATVVHGPRQNVTITSDPPGAAVTVLSGSEVKASGVTPAKVRLRRRDANLTVRLEKPGCEPAEMKLKRSVSGWTYGNLIAANPFAMQGYDSEPVDNYVKQVTIAVPALFAVDFVSGGAYKLPKAVNLRFCGGSGTRDRGSDSAQRRAASGQRPTGSG